VHGFEAGFVRNNVLPDWWDDSLAANPANRAAAELAVARLLGLDMAELGDPTSSITLPGVENFRLKCRSGARPEDVRPAVIVAKKLAEVVAGALKEVVDFQGLEAASEIRREILTNSGMANLQSLLAFCWAHGVAVIHVMPTRLPGSRHFDGLACYVGTRPVIILGSGKDSPPWLAFHLAHELGHVCCGHVKPGDKPLVESDLGPAKDDQQERVADRFATEVLTGKPELELRLSGKPFPAKLATASARFGREHLIDPGTVSLLCARSGEFWAHAQSALKILGVSTGGQDMVSSMLAQRLDLDSVPESMGRLLSCLSMAGV